MHSRLVLLITAASAAFCAETPYMKPSQAVLDVMNAPLTPTMSVSPTRDYVIMMQSARYPSIAEVAQPMLRLAGIRIDSNTNGMHLAPNHTGFSLKRLSDNTEIPMKLPAGHKLGSPVWSPDGRQFAFTNTTDHAIEIWLGNTATGQTHQIGGVQINGVRGGFGGGARGGRGGGDGSIDWLGDSRTLLVRLVPSGRGPVPALASVPVGPHIQESLGHAGPVPTYEDMLQNPHDEDLFEYYATSQLAYIDSSSAQVTKVGKPAIFEMAQVSPDGQYIMVSRIHRPFSYQLPMASFPQDVEVWNRKGSVEYTVAKLGLAERVAIGGVRTGPRSYQWQPTQSATLTFVEAMDGGNPKEQVPHRDRLLMISAPFKDQPKEVFESEQRFASMEPLEKSGMALVNDVERRKQMTRTIVVDLNKPGDPGKIIFSRNVRERYKDPGRPLLRELPNGKRVVMMEGDSILLEGEGASPTGDHPFLDRYNIATGKTERLFQAQNGFETLEAVLDDSGKRFITLHESPSDPPNYYLHDGATVKPLTNYPDPTPQIRMIKKQLVNYKRADGVPLSFTLYLPPEYKPGMKLPALLWAYPYEYTDVNTASQVTGSTERYTTLVGHMLFLMHGYAILENAAMPIIGDPETVNNTYVQQLVMDAKAAVDKAVELGMIDRDRIGVGGHSYGAFMTANLLAHTNFFHAGMAESGAYNRTLTPFGFQSEQRTFWEAPEVYTTMSPFWSANKIKTPLLMIHGEADDNTGTFPIQSERLYAAIRGNGGTVRLVMLPDEAHGYRGKETLEHVLWEEMTWFDKYLKGDHADAMPTGTR